MLFSAMSKIQLGVFLIYVFSFSSNYNLFKMTSLYNFNAVQLLLPNNTGPNRVASLLGSSIKQDYYGVLSVHVITACTRLNRTIAFLKVRAVVQLYTQSLALGLNH